jgi:hypothetical protein
MPSHEYRFTSRDLAAALAPAAGGVLALAAVLHLGARLDLLPVPVPADLDHTVLAEKARLAAAGHDAVLILSGDSSCLMDVDALELGGLIETSVLNLGTLSYLDLHAQGELLSRHFEAGPPEQNPPATVLLLMHPDTLRRSAAETDYEEYLMAQFSPDPSARLQPARNEWEAWLACDILRQRVVQPWIPTLLGGRFAVVYGSNRGASRHLHRHYGSLIDPTLFDPAIEAGSREYRLHPRLEEEGRAFRLSVPDRVRLIAGITPVPATLAGPDHELTARAMLRQLGEWLGAAATLTDVPLTLPESEFATRTHLNRRGAQAFTRELARQLRSLNFPAGDRRPDSNRATAQGRDGSARGGPAR